MDRKKKKSSILLVSFLVVFVLIVVGVVSVSVGAGQAESRQITRVTSTLEKILEISDLETAQIFYNAVATRKDDANEKTLYFAAYEGTITAGVDFEQVKINEVDKDNKIITITIPEPKILDTKVDPGTIECIFVDKKADTENVLQDAYKCCLADLEQRSEEDADKLLDVAYENAKNAIDGLSSPWFNQLNSDYTLEYQRGGES